LFEGVDDKREFKLEEEAGMELEGNRDMGVTGLGEGVEGNGVKGCEGNGCGVCAGVDGKPKLVEGRGDEGQLEFDTEDLGEGLGLKSAQSSVVATEVGTSDV
jgi:hypothetical protein